MYEIKLKTRLSFDRDKPMNIEFGIWFRELGVLLWAGNDSGVQIGPLTITQRGSV